MKFIKSASTINHSLYKASAIYREKFIDNEKSGTVGKVKLLTKM